MRSSLLIMISFLAGCQLLALSAAGDPPARGVVFEGRVIEVPTELTPGLHSGQVLSGSLGWALPESAASTPAQPHILEDGLGRAEFTLDRNHIATYIGELRGGPSYIALYPAGEKPDAADLVSLHLPIQGEVTPNGYTAIWLEIFLHDPSRSMLAGAHWAAGLPHFQDGWFYLTFLHPPSGKTVRLAGELILWSESTGDSPELTPQEYRELLLQLDTKLRQRELEIAELERQLARREAELASREVLIQALREELAMRLEGSQLAEVEAHNAALRQRLAKAQAEGRSAEQQIRQLTASEASLLEENKRLKAQWESRSASSSTAADVIEVAPPPSAPRFEDTPAPSKNRLLASIFASQPEEAASSEEQAAVTVAPEPITLPLSASAPVADNDSGRVTRRGPRR